MINYSEKEFKTIINVRKFIDNWFWDKYSLNPYNGCEFSCIYCDTRSSKYNMHEDFGENIIVKKDAADMLDKRISNARTLKPDIVAIGGAGDAYQPAEKKYRNTQKCLEVLHKHNYPVFISTKSDMLKQDLQLLDDIGNNSWCCISLTITSTKSEITAFLEPGAASPEKRFSLISHIKTKYKNIQAGVSFIPIVPFFSDSDSELENMVRLTKESGADYILFGGGTTLSDKQAVWFLNHIQKNYPQKIEGYEKIYRFKYNRVFYNGQYGPDNKYSTEIHKKLFVLCKEYDLNFRIKRFIPEDFRKYNYFLSEIFLNKAYERQMNNIKSTNLFWAGMNIQNLKESIIDIAQRNELQTIRNVNADIEEYIYTFIHSKFK